MLKEIIERVKQYSMELADQQVFINQPWVLCNEEQQNNIYYFQDDNTLLVIEPNGNTVVGKWKLLKNVDALMVTYKDHNWTLKRRFIDRCILIFTKGDDHFLFYNQNNEEEVGGKLIEFEHYLERLLPPDPLELPPFPLGLNPKDYEYNNAERMSVFLAILIGLYLFYIAFLFI